MGFDMWGFNLNGWGSSGHGVHLSGTDGDRAYVERWVFTEGIMYFPKSWSGANSEGYFSIDAGVATWIPATHNDEYQESYVS